MKPRRYDPSVDSAILLGIGNAHNVADATAVVVGKLYLPDPEARRGWREQYLVAAPKPGTHVGFRR